MEERRKEKAEGNRKKKEGLEWKDNKGETSAEIK